MDGRHGVATLGTGVKEGIGFVPRRTLRLPAHLEQGWQGSDLRFGFLSHVV